MPVVLGGAALCLSRASVCIHPPPELHAQFRARGQPTQLVSGKMRTSERLQRKVLNEKRTFTNSTSRLRNVLMEK